MAIRVRRGNEADFDVNKMLPGEWAVSLDTRYVRMCFAPGVCLRMATYEGFESDMERVEAILAEVESIEEAIKVIQRDINANVDIAIEQKELASGYAEQSKEYARQAKESAERAAEVSDISYGSSDRAGIVAPQDIYVDPSNGHMELIATASASPLKNSYDGGLRFTEMIGASEQNTTTGKNLLNVNRAESASYNVKMTNNNDGTVTLSGTATGNAYVSALKQDINLPLGSYIFSGVPVNNLNIKFILYEYDSSNTFVTSYQDTGNGVKVNVTDTTHLFRPQFVVTKDTVVPNLVCYPMLRLEDTDSTFEPYTGGKASPNPDYPQEIKSVSISGMKTSGKNLLKITATGKTTNGITFRVNSDGSVTANGTASANSWFALFQSTMLNGNYVLNGCPSGGGNDTYRLQLRKASDSNDKTAQDFGNGGAFNMEDNTIEYVLHIGVMKGQNVNNLTFYPMIRYADVADATFQPYKESVISLSGFQLNGIDDVKDRLVNKDGLWQIERNIYSYTLSGNETGWNLTSTRIGSVWIDFVNKLGLTRAVAGRNSFSNRFVTVPTLTDYTKYGQALVETAGFNMWFKDGTVSGESEIQTFLANNNVTFSYVMETPTYEVLPLADQVALNSLLTFDGTTYLDIESALEPQFALEYGTSKVGGYTLQSLNTAEANQARIVAMETVTNNMAAAVLQGEE